MGGDTQPWKKKPKFFVPPPPPRIFGFVAKQGGGRGGNACHLFAELDPEQPASAIVTFVTKVLLGTRRP